MNKVIIFLCILISACCGRISSSHNSDKDVSGRDITIQKDNNNREDFAYFLEHFVVDSVFQRSRLIMPFSLTYNYLYASGASYDTTIVSDDLSSWAFIAIPLADTMQFHSKNIIIRADTAELFLNGAGQIYDNPKSISGTFIRSKNKWFCQSLFIVPGGITKSK